MQSMVLVVDANDNEREALVWALRASGFRCMGVATAQSVLPALAMYPIALLLIDADLPDRGGVALVRSMAQTQSLARVPAILMALPGTAIAPDLTVLMKPLEMTNLLDVVTAVLGKAPDRSHRFPGGRVAAPTIAKS